MPCTLVLLAVALSSSTSPKPRIELCLFASEAPVAVPDFARRAEPALALGVHPNEAIAPAGAVTTGSTLRG